MLPNEKVVNAPQCCSGLSACARRGGGGAKTKSGAPLTLVPSKSAKTHHTHTTTHTTSQQQQNSRYKFAAVMLGAKSTPAPISSPGVGALTVTIDRAAKTGVYKLLLAKLTGYKFSHIHLGNATTNGPIILWLDPPTAGDAKSVVPADIGAKFVSGAFSAANFTKEIAGWDAFVAALDAGCVVVCFCFVLFFCWLGAARACAFGSPRSFSLSLPQNRTHTQQQRAATCTATATPSRTRRARSAAS